MMSPQYLCLTNQTATFERYSLVPLRPDDIFAIKEWRNAQIDILRQGKPLTDQEQRHYYQEVVTPTYAQHNPEMILFSFLHDHQLIGYGGLVHINWSNQRAEVSFLVAPSRRTVSPVYQSDFHAFFTMVKGIAFDQLQMHRLTTETFSFRQRTIQLLEHHGFEREGRLREHIKVAGGYTDSLMHGCVQHTSGSAQCNVLVTSLGRKTPLVKAIRQATDEMGISCILHGGDHDVRCLGQYFVDRFWPMKSDRDLTELEIINYCKEHSIKAIIPTRDAELPFFACIAKTLKKHDINVMISPEPGVAICNDKIEFYQRCAGLPMIQIIQTETDINQIPAKRLVVKERYGSGSKNIGLNLAPDDASAHACTLAAPVFQPFIAGKEYSIDLYADMQGRCRGVVARTRDLVEHGESQVTTTVRHESLERQCTVLAHRLGLRGHLVFQAIEDEQKNVHFIECNCRFGGASTLSVAAGLHSFHWFFSECIGKDPDELPWIRSPREWRLIRTAADRFLEVV